MGRQDWQSVSPLEILHRVQDWTSFGLDKEEDLHTEVQVASNVKVCFDSNL